MAEMGFWNFAQQDPEKLALVDPDERLWTRGELLEKANQIAHGLRAAGLGQGDCVAVVLENCAEFYQIHLAVTQLGMYMTPINNHLTGPEIAYIVQDSGAKVFFGSARFSEACQAAREELDFPTENAFSVGPVPGFRPMEDLTAGQPTTLPEDRLAGQVMNYTSGTTGRPKGALRAVSIALSTELGPKKIRVNTVIPTWMWGPPVEGYVRWQASERSVPEAQIKDELEALFSLGEIPADDDVAEAVVVFLSDRLRMVTGEFLRVDAGQLKRL